MTSTLPTYLTVAIMLMALFALMVAFSPAVFAHGGGGATEVSPDDPNCMGQLARLHANGKNPGNNPDTVNGFGTDQPHPGLGGPYDGSIQDQAKAFQAYCGIGQTQ